MTRFLLPLVLVPLLAAFGRVTPRLEPPAPIEDAAGPCFRWGALECCYVDEER